MNINQFREENYKEYIDDICDWVDEQYSKYFKSCFDSVRKMHESMKSQVRPISDSELEWILVELPMTLFSISEDLNKIRLEVEVIKLRKKTIKSELEQKASELVRDSVITKADIKSWVDTELADHDILLSAYNSLITRVESEISFSKELIMGCKKIWDSRRKTEASNPVGEVTPSTSDKVPNYSDRYSGENRYREPYIR